MKLYTLTRTTHEVYINGGKFKIKFKNLNYFIN